MTFVIDDALLAAKSRGQAVFIVKTFVMLLTALKFYLSWDKCQLAPVQRGKFLGLIVDSSKCKMFVPADKKAYIKETIAAMLELGSYTNRQLASVAGMLMSISAAVSMAPLYTGRLYQSMGKNMDSIASDVHLAREDLQYWHDYIELCDGESLLRRSDSIHVCGDASNGAYTPNLELQHPMVMSFDAYEIHLMQTGQLSSVFREVKNVRLAIEAIVFQLGSSGVAGKVIVYTGDCLPAIQDLLKMKWVQYMSFLRSSSYFALQLRMMLSWTLSGCLEKQMLCCMQTCYLE